MKQNITVVSLGPGDPELLTAQSLNTMKKAKRLIFRTAQHPVCAALTEAGVQSTSLDDYYDRYEDFDEMHRDMAKALWAEAEHHAVVFACWMPEQTARCGSFGHSSRRTRSCASCRA